MRYERVDLPVITGLYEELLDIEAEHGELPWVHNQLNITSTIDHVDDPSYGVGALRKDYSAGTRIVHDQWIEWQIPNREGPSLNSADFRYICNIFLGTKFHEVAKLIESKYKRVGRIRLMRSWPFTCFSWHNDDEFRLHYPILTHPSCFMIVEEEIKHLPLDEWCLIDTTRKHSIFNGSRQQRIHIVAEILER